MIKLFGKSRKLNNGHDIPSIALGTWQTTNEEIKTVIPAAISNGYTHIDGAAIYKNEEAIGRCFSKIVNDDSNQNSSLNQNQSSIPSFNSHSNQNSNSSLINRSQLFMTSKLWDTEHEPKRVRAACLKTLKDLNLKYLDLYLMHWPFACKSKYNENENESENDNQSSHSSLHDPISNKVILIPSVSILDTWKAMESLVDDGLVRSIGVSNFTISKLKNLLMECRIKPVVNQVELHPFLPQDDLLEYCHENEILLEAYSPLGGAGNEPSLIQNQTIIKISQITNSTPAQVLIGWAIKRETIPLVKTRNPSRLIENATIPNLDSNMMKMIADEIKSRHRFCDSMEWHKITCFDD